MAVFDQVLAGASEKLYGDESLRSNLTDAQAKIILDWAMARLTEHVNAVRDEASARQVVKEEWPRLRALLSDVNGIMGKGGTWRLPDAVEALEPLLTGDQPFTPEEVKTLLASLMQGTVEMTRGDIEGLVAGQAKGRNVVCETIRRLFRRGEHSG